MMTATIEELTRDLQQIRKSTLPHIHALSHIEDWIVSEEMSPGKFNHEDVIELMCLAAQLESWVTTYYLRKSALNKERIENLEAKIEDLTGEVTHAD